jgi:uncharacterized membrane protein
MDVQVRSVTPARGWAWIAGGFVLFLRSPLQWIVLLLILFAAKSLLSAFPVKLLAALFSVVAMLLMPVFMAGLMDGCRALEEGRPLKVGHLAQGFRRNAANLVTLGGIYLVGNLIIVMIIFSIGGEAIAAMASTLAKHSTITPEIRGQMQEATATVARAVLVGAALSLPLLMALYFAPVLAYFDGARPLQALKLSLLACLKNMLPMLVYGLVLLAALLVLVPIGIRFREFDLGLWLIAPVLIPSIYVSYRDIFATSDASAPSTTVPG